jgi:Secretion system C-terminal sorting domain
MKKYFLLLFIVFVTAINGFSQIYGVGNGNGFSYNCYTQADNPFLQIFRTGNGGGKMMDCIIWGQLVTLPKSFHSIEAVCGSNKVNLHWSAPYQTGNKYFVIERSTDKIHFTSAGSVPVLQNNSQITEYRFDDINILPGNLYYRIKQIKLNGGFEYSPVTSANCKKDFKENILVYPNPTRGLINIINKEPIVSVIIKNLLGQPLITKKINAERATVNIEQLPQGMYYVEVITGRNTTYHMVTLNKN